MRPQKGRATSAQVGGWKYYLVKIKNQSVIYRFNYPAPGQLQQRGEQGLFLFLEKEKQESFYIFEMPWPPCVF
jgi:hypothetical protein